MSRSKRSKVEQLTDDQEKPVQAGPVVVRQQALIDFLHAHGYTNSKMESHVGVGRPKPARSGDETTGERIALYLSGTYDLVPVRHAALCAGVHTDGKLPCIEDDFEHWQLPAPLRQAMLPFLFFSQAYDQKPVTRMQVRRSAIQAQQELKDRRRLEKDRLVACVGELEDRLNQLLNLLASGNGWATPHPLLAISPWCDTVQLDLSGTGTTFFTYRWDRLGSNPFDHPVEHPQPLVYTHDEEGPKERFQCLLGHLDECLRSIVISKDERGSAPGCEIHKLTKSTCRAIDSLLKRMNGPRLVSWHVSHPACVLDDNWWETHPNLSPVLIRQKLPNEQDWCPLPEDLPAQPILFAVEHNTPEKRCLRFLELMRDATLSVRPDMMVDIGADLIGMDAWKSLNLIARHGWV